MSWQISSSSLIVVCHEQLSGDCLWWDQLQIVEFIICLIFELSDKLQIVEFLLSVGILSNFGAFRSSNIKWEELISVGNTHLIFGAFRLKLKDELQLLGCLLQQSLPALPFSYLLFSTCEWFLIPFTFFTCVQFLDLISARFYLCGCSFNGINNFNIVCHIWSILNILNSLFSERCCKTLN